MKLSDLKTTLGSTVFQINDKQGDENQRCCDYFESGVGYVFSSCDALDCAYLLEAKMTGADNDKYKAMQPDADKLNWNWEDLKGLINAYYTGGKDIGGGVTGVEDFRSVDIDWDGL